MVNGGELLYHLPYQFLIDVDRGAGKAHVPSKGASLRVLDNILHFRESGALMMVIWVLTEATCS